MLTPFDEIIDDMINLYPAVFSGGASSSGAFYKKLDDGSFEIRMDVPGVTKDDTAIVIEQNKLLVEARRKSSYAKTYNFSFLVPKTHDIEHTGAALENGVLVLTIPVSREAKKEVRKITIK